MPERQPPRGDEPPGAGPAPEDGVGAHRTRRRVAAGGPSGRFRATRATAAALGALLLGAVLAAGGGTLLPAAAARAAGPAGGVLTASSPAGGSPALVLTGQTSWLAPGQPFDLKLKAGPGTPAADRLALTVAVYPCLTTVSAFDQAATSSSGPAGEAFARTTSPIPWTSLPAAPGGGVDLSIPVATGGSATAPPPALPAAGPGGLVVDLRSTSAACTSTTRTGVYPVRVELVDPASGDPVGGITTDLVYTGTPADTQKLRFAAVLPVATTLGPAPSVNEAAVRADPSSTLARPGAAVTAALGGLVAAVADHPAVPVTIAASPQTVQVLGAHSTAVAQLSQLAGSPDVHQLAFPPYVPVDATSLVGAGMGDEVLSQVQRGAQVLGSDVLARSAVAQATPKVSGPWITGGALDDDTLDLLHAAGYRQLVIPAGDVSSSPTNGSTAVPFVVDSPHGSAFTTVTANADLSSRFGADPGNPVLAAHQVLAELAQIYYERPNDTAARAVVAVPPATWRADPLFVQTLLAGLGTSPVVEPVTTAGLFAAFPRPVTCRVGCRLATAPGPVGLSADAVRTERSRIAAFASAVPDAHALVQQFGDLVLAAEAATLRPAQQAQVLRGTDAALRAQLSQLGVAGDKTITLTSRNGRVPVTITSLAPYPATGILTLSSDKLLFTNGTTRFSQVTTLSRATNVVYVNVEARTSGEFKMDVTFRSPSGGLVLADGVVTVRSTATSFVGVALSLGAVAVLLAWWVRTTWQRRRRRGGGADDGTGPSTEEDAVTSTPPAAAGTVPGDP